MYPERQAFLYYTFLSQAKFSRIYQLVGYFLALQIQGFAFSDKQNYKLSLGPSQSQYLAYYLS